MARQKLAPSPSAIAPVSSSSLTERKERVREEKAGWGARLWLNLPVETGELSVDQPSRGGWGGGGLSTPIRKGHFEMCQYLSMITNIPRGLQDRQLFSPPPLLLSPGPGGRLCTCTCTRTQGNPKAWKEKWPSQTGCLSVQSGKRKRRGLWVSSSPRVPVLQVEDTGEPPGAQEEEAGPRRRLRGSG